MIPRCNKNNNRRAFFFKTAHPTPQNWVVETVVRKTPGTLSVWRKSMMIKTVDFHTCCNWPRLAVGPLQGRNLLKGSFSATMVHPFFSYYSCFWQIETVNTYIKQIFKIKYIHTSKKHIQLTYNICMQICAIYWLLYELNTYTNKNAFGHPATGLTGGPDPPSLWDDPKSEYWSKGNQDSKCQNEKTINLLPIPSMYGIFTYI